MTIGISDELIEGSTVSQSADGYVATRMFIATTTAQETKVQVLLHDDIPQYGDIHPDFDGIDLVPIYALDRQCDHEMGDPAIFRVTINYRRPTSATQPPSEDEADAIIQVGSSVTSSKTELDAAGAQIVVTLTDQPDQTGTVDIQVPESVLTFSRRESSSPRSKARTYVGKINSVALASGDYDIGTLLCLGIEGESTDGGESYNVTYRFQYRPGKWAATVVYIDPETDRPHEEVAFPSTGVVTVDVYAEANFSALNLPWSA